jgi:hypothetical protein
VLIDVFVADGEETVLDSHVLVPGPDPEGAAEAPVLPVLVRAWPSASCPTGELGAARSWPWRVEVNWPADAGRTALVRDVEGRIPGAYDESVSPCRVEDSPTSCRCSTTVVAGRMTAPTAVCDKVGPTC